MSDGKTLRVTPRLVLGLTLLFVGVLFTLDNLGWIDAGNAWQYWPLVLAAIGIMRLTAGAWVAGSVWIVIGLWWLLYNLRVIDLHVFDLWPIVFIAVGFVLITRALGSRRTAPKGSDAEHVSGVAVLSGVRRASTSASFSGGDFTAVMGGCDVDLRDAELAEEGATIDVFAFWGGVDVKVPDHWQIEPRVTAILGGFADKTAQKDIDRSRSLIVRGFAMMGGVELRN